MNEFEILATATAILVAYQIIAVRLSASFQPLRKTAADIGERLLAEGRLPPDAQKAVTATMGLSFSRKAAWVLLWCMISLPFRKIFSGRPLETFGSLPSESREDMDKFIRLSLTSMLANSPIAFLLAGMFTFFKILVYPIDAAMRDAQAAILSVGNKRTA